MSNRDRRVLELLQALERATYYARLNNRPHVVYMHRSADDLIIGYYHMPQLRWADSLRSWHRQGVKGVKITTVNPDGSHEP